MTYKAFIDETSYGDVMVTADTCDPVFNFYYDSNGAISQGDVWTNVTHNIDTSVFELPYSCLHSCKWDHESQLLMMKDVHPRILFPMSV